jgi:hypothetical protein
MSGGLGLEAGMKGDGEAEWFRNGMGGEEDEEDWWSSPPAK